MFKKVVDLLNLGRAQTSGGAGAKWRYEDPIADLGEGVCCSPSARGIMIHDLITILCRVGFLFCKLSEQYSQTNFPVIKTKPFKVTKYLKSMTKIIVIILPLL